MINIFAANLNLSSPSLSYNQYNDLSIQYSTFKLAAQSVSQSVGPEVLIKLQMKDEKAGEEVVLGLIFWEIFVIIMSRTMTVTTRG